MSFIGNSGPRRFDALACGRFTNAAKATALGPPGFAAAVFY
jgi:hypothetical protein